MGENIPPASRSSVEREHREKSGSDDRSISQLAGSSTKKVTIEVESNSQYIQSLSEYDLTGFQMRPRFGERFSSAAVEGVIENVLKDFFFDKKDYNFDKASEWVEQISRELTNKVRQLNFPRYKLITHVTIGEHIGGGIHIGMKCLWDAETDLYASYTFLADNIFCVGTVCGVYFY